MEHIFSETREQNRLRFIFDDSIEMYGISDDPAPTFEEIALQLDEVLARHQRSPVAIDVVLGQ